MNMSYYLISGALSRIWKVGSFGTGVKSKECGDNSGANCGI